MLRRMFFGQKGAKSMRLTRLFALILIYTSISLMTSYEVKANPFFVGRFSGLLGGPDFAWGQMS